MNIEHFMTQSAHRMTGQKIGKVQGVEGEKNVKN